MYLLPNAKINIGLNITHRREDGYHNLETVFYPIPLTDSLKIEPLRLSNENYELLTTGLKIDSEQQDNLVVRVFVSLQKEFGLPPTSIQLSKHIPSGAGLGGGSSDAAFMMQMLNEAYNLQLSPEQMEQRLLAFGADCPFFVRNKPVFAQGIGNEFSPINLRLKGYYLLLVKPDIHISTQQAYANVVARKPQHSLKSIIETEPITNWRYQVHNQFEETLFIEYPQLDAIKQTLYDMGALYASMSGSGSAIYGIFTRPITDEAKVFSDSFTFSSPLT